MNPTSGSMGGGRGVAHDLRMRSDMERRNSEVATKR